MPLYVGTSGWDYSEWKGGFYPLDLPRKRFLEHYSSRLTACEINTTFYRLQPEGTFPRWVESIEPSFRFAVKAHRRLTHTKRIGSLRGQAFFHEFIESLEPFGERLHCVLFQFPPYRERDDDGIVRLLESVPRHLRCALEFRHESWHSPDVLRLVAEAGGTVCYSDTTGQPPPGLLPGPMAYVRLRAPLYSEGERAGWLSLLQREAKERDVYAFAKHRDVPAGDPFTGVGFAEWLVTRGTCS
jgi:uncharacterized protein YecE (DUF72 family)